jgi:prepilin-type N-terminal cleavage/methylation domain-containing protein
MKQNKKSAFSLIEMAIVVVITSILIVAAIRGDVYLRSAKVIAIFGEQNALKQNINNFESRFGYMAGDINIATLVFAGNTACTNGNGDYLIKHIDVNNSEIYQLWLHLNLAGLITEKYTGKTTATNGTFISSIGINVPNSKAVTGAANGYIAHSYLRNQITSNPDISSKKYNFLDLQNFATQDPNGIVTTGVVTSIIMRALDIKFDDGKPLEGKILGINASNSSECNDAGQSYSIGATYTGKSTKTCIASFVIE